MLPRLFRGPDKAATATVVTAVTAAEKEKVEAGVEEGAREGAAVAEAVTAVTVLCRQAAGKEGEEGSAERKVAAAVKEETAAKEAAADKEGSHSLNLVSALIRLPTNTLLFDKYLTIGSIMPSAQPIGLTTLSVAQASLSNYSSLIFSKILLSSGHSHLGEFSIQLSINEPLSKIKINFGE